MDGLMGLWIYLPMDLRIYALLHLCFYTSMHLCRYAGMQIRTYACTHVRNVSMCACVHVCMYVSALPWNSGTVQITHQTK